MSGQTTATPPTVFTNCRLCRGGQLVSENLAVSSETGEIVNDHHAGLASFDIVDMKDAIIAPGFIELQTNGMRGFHFAHFEQPATYAEKLTEVARYLPQTGVAGFYATIPTVHADEFKKILPNLHPREIPDGATLLGAHAEGPYLHSSKKGAHNESLFHQPSTPATEVYGQTAKSNETLKLVTLAPELNGIGTPYFGIIPDGNHLHPSVASMLFRANPSKCITITDSIELAGLPDGTYPGHSQIPHHQTKVGTRVVIDGTETLIGGCAGLDRRVRHLSEWCACSLAEAVRTVTEHVVDLMGDRARGRLEVGRRADMLVLNLAGRVRETWVAEESVVESGCASLISE
ncbi:Metallo-dependent hydrolase [Teratosphaeria nubilosa]|uniref:Metallo-dependent hydrolase n=1 Tax=Teratosphaeria nubilosa TaxID=161662 RepID=A0A6G1L132_9PEZI|nr:Metallo-dependent hydrolase [Teratosphaeria nubilosa]